MNIQSLREEIARVKARRKLSNAKLARKSGLAHMTIANALSGARKPQARTITRICKTLKIDIGGKQIMLSLPVAKEQRVLREKVPTLHELWPLNRAQAAFVRDFLREQRKAESSSRK